MKKTTVVPLMVFLIVTDKKRQCSPLCFFFIVTDKKTTVLPLMFYLYRGCGGAVGRRCWLMSCQTRFKSLLKRATTVGTLNVSPVLLIEWYHLISLMSLVKSSRTFEHGAGRDLVAQWLRAVGE